MNIQECLVIYDEEGDCQKASRIIASKCRKLQAENVARVLLELIDEYELEDLVSEVLVKLENCPLNYFETILDFDTKLSDLYNN